MLWWENLKWGTMMTIGAWFAKLAWTAFTKWIEKDPIAAEQRLAVLAGKYIEILVVALEANAAPPVGTITFVPKV